MVIAPLAQVYQVKFWMMHLKSPTAKRTIVMSNGPWIISLDMGPLPRRMREEKTEFKTSRYNLIFTVCATRSLILVTLVLCFMRQRNIKVIWEEAIHWREKCAQEDPVTNQVFPCVISYSPIFSPLRGWG